jgi:hypothetical protein
MRLIIVFMFLASLSSMASTTLELISDDYSVQATLTASTTNNAIGTVSMHTQNQGNCTGTFALDLNAGTLTVTLDGISDNGTGGGCNNESVTVFIGASQYNQIMNGEEVSLDFCSTVFNNEIRSAVVRVIS